MYHFLSEYFPGSHAFLIGIDQYDHLNHLENAVNDVRGIHTVLKEPVHGFQVHPPLLNSGYADIINLLTKTMPAVVGENDRILFYFAGHGIATDSDQEGIPEGYLLPRDADPRNGARSIAMGTLRESLENLPCRHVLIILDCCFSGAFRWAGQAKRGIRLTDIPKKIYQERFDRFAEDPAWQVLTSASYDQEAFDSLYHKPLGTSRNKAIANHSPFAFYLIKALEGEADIIPNDQPDGLITVSEIYWFIRDKLEPATTAVSKQARQTPGFFTLPRHDKGEYFFLSPKVVLNLPHYDAQLNPYKGLEAYEMADQHHYFGRAEVVGELRNFLAEHQLMIIAGASGTGKSSLVNAGLLPLLREKQYALLSMRPGEEPLAELEALLHSDGYLQGGKAALIIDQFEELITQTNEPQQRSAFQQRLRELLDTQPENLKVIITVRSDFEPQFLDGPLASLWKASRFVVPAFSSAELREIVVRPAMERVILFDPPELVDRIVEEVQNAPGALPMLSFTMSEMYEGLKRSGEFGAFRLSEYEKLGGVAGSLQTSADRLFNSLSDAQQTALKKLMLRMISFEGGQIAKRKVFLSELVYTDPGETSTIRSVLTQLTEARLIVQSRDLNDRPFVEPAHDTLIQSWARLWEWVNSTGEENLLLQNRLREAVAVYRENGENNNLLFHDDPRLDQLNAVRQSGWNWFNKKEEAFIAKSIAFRSRKRRRFITTLISTSAVLLLLTIAAVWFGFEARRQAGIARQEAQSSSFAALAAQRAGLNPTQAVRLAEHAVRIKPDNESARQALQNILSNSQDQLFYQRVLPGQNAAAFSPDGRYIIGAANNGRVKIWTTGGALIRDIEAASDTVTAVQFSQDGQRFLTAGWDGRVKIWSFDGSIIFNIKCHDYPIDRAVFSANDRQIIVSSWGHGSLLLLNLDPTPRLAAEYYAPVDQPFFGSRTKTTYLRRVVSREPNRGILAFSDDLKYVLSDDPDRGGQLDTWLNTPDTSPPPAMAGLSQTNAAAFSRDSNRLLIGNRDGSVRLLNPESGKVLELPAAIGSGITTVAISPKNNYFAAANESGTIFIWEADGQLFAALNGHSGYITNLSFSPDEQYLISSTLLSEDRHLLWDLGQKKQSFLAYEERRNVNAAFFTNDQQQFLVSSLDGVKLVDPDGNVVRNFNLGALDNASFRMDLSDDRQFFAAALFDALLIQRVSESAGRRIVAHEGKKILSVDIAPNGQRIVTTGMDGQIKIWSAVDGQLIRAIHRSGSVLSYLVVFTPDSEGLLLGKTSGEIEVIDLEGNSKKVIPAHDDVILFMKASHDSQYLLTGGIDGAAKLWTSDWQLLNAYEGFKKGILSAAFSPDDQYILLGGEAGTARIYHRDGSLIQTFSEHRNMIKTVDFAPAGDVVLTGDDGGMVYLWEVKKDWLSSGPVARLSPAERLQFGMENDLTDILQIADMERLLDFAFYFEKKYHEAATVSSRADWLEKIRQVYDRALAPHHLQQATERRLRFLGNYFGERYVPDEQLKMIYQNNIDKIVNALNDSK